MNYYIKLVSDAVVFRGLERLLVIVAAMFFGWLGFRLFCFGLESMQSKPDARGLVYRMTLIGAVAGLCLMAFGCAVTIYTIMTRLEGRPVNPPGEATAQTGHRTITLSPLAAATKETPFVNTLGMKFVPVPITGGPTNAQRVLFSVWDTRVQDYEAFIEETGREWPDTDFPQGPTHPAVNVSWEDANLFCQWLTAREQAAGRLPSEWRYRLPTDHEWSCTVGLGAREDAAMLPADKSGKITDTYPWGEQWPPPAGAGNYAGEELLPALAAGKYPFIKDVIAGYNDGYVNTSPVGSFSENRFGLYDIGGNTWQWCEDYYDKDQQERVLRGASWFRYGSEYLQSSCRHHIEPGFRYYNYGFRCVVAMSAR